MFFQRVFLVSVENIFIGLLLKKDMFHAEGAARTFCKHVSGMLEEHLGSVRAWRGVDKGKKRMN